MLAFPRSPHRSSNTAAWLVQAAGRRLLAAGVVPVPEAPQIAVRVSQEVI